VGRLIDVSQLEGWLPARVSWEERQPLIDWLYVGEHRSSAVSFDQTLERCLELPFNLLFRHQTSIDVLRQAAETRPGIRPAGFIFHSARAAASMLTKMLAALPANLVVSEARPIDSVLRARHFEPSVTDAQRVEWLRWLVSNLAQPGPHHEQQLFIKFDSWSIFELDIIRLAFPGVPWIFVYSDPLEELVSQIQHRDAHMIPGVIEPELFGLDNSTILEIPPEDYCARVLGAVFAAALQRLPDGGLLVNSSQLPAALAAISGFFDLSWTDIELEVMTPGAARWNLLTESDRNSTASCRDAGRLTEAARAWAYPAYDALEQARLAQPFRTLAACDLSCSRAIITTT